MNFALDRSFAMKKRDNYPSIYDLYLVYFEWLLNAQSEYLHQTCHDEIFNSKLKNHHLFPKPRGYNKSVSLAHYLNSLPVTAEGRSSCQRSVAKIANSKTFRYKIDDIFDTVNQKSFDVSINACLGNSIERKGLKAWKRGGGEKSRSLETPGLCLRNNASVFAEFRSSAAL